MLKLLSLSGWAFINLLGRTLRLVKVNSVSTTKAKAGFAFWHGEQFIPCYAHRNEHVVIMTSLSRDGEIQSGIMNLLKYTVVRGSSTRGAQRALVEVLRYVKIGRSAAFAVDGPKGPYKQAKPGLIYLAQKSKIPIIPVSCCAKRYKVFDRSWDKYELPIPFTKAVAAYGNPIMVSETDNIEQKTAELEGSLKSLSEFTHDNYWSKDPGHYLKNHPRPKILVIQPSRIGDVVFTLPSVHAIRKKYPGAWIGWIVDERCAPILEGNKDIDELIVFDRRKLTPAYIINTARYLRSKKIDISIDFHGLAKSAFLVLLAGARIKIASASTNGMRELSWLFSREIAPAKSDAHCVERHFAAARHLGCSDDDLSFPIEMNPGVVNLALTTLLEKGIDLEKPYAVVHPGGGWRARRWFPERFSKLIERLSKELGLQIILIGGREGGSGEKGLNEEIVGKAGVKIYDLEGLFDLQELAVVLKKCAVFVANEAGPMHIATALGVPAVAILGPTDSARTGPFRGNTTIIQHKVECQPCRERNCNSKECMELVTVDEVFNAVKEKLKV